MTTLKLRKFDPRKIPPNSVVMIIGKRGTGKTTLTADLFFHNRKKFDAGICFSSTEESNMYWGRHICDTLIHSEFDEEVFKNFVAQQRRINSKVSKTINSFALLEDCMYSGVLKKNKDIRGCFFNGRHWGIFLVVTMQYVLDLPPELRSNVDFVFVLRNNVKMDREKIWKHFAGFVPSFQLFEQLMNKCTQGYECMVINNTVRSNEMCDCLSWYEATIRDKFKIGKDAMWIYHYQMRKQEEEEESDDDFQLAVNYRTSSITKLR